MLAEVSGRSAESLVLMPKTELELFRDRAKGHSVIENYGWRSLFLATPLVLAFVFLTTVLRWLGNADPSAKTLAGLASVLTLVASLVVVTGVWMTIKRLRGDLALFALLAGIAIPALLTIIVFFFYPT